MISFEGFVVEDNAPIYLQIPLFIKRGVIAGTICDGDELPSRRTLSALLGVNPNTVQKAYKLLEDEGLIVSHSGSKSYMHLRQGKREEIKNELLKQDAESLVLRLKQMGVSREQLIFLIEEIWQRGDNI